MYTYSHEGAFYASILLVVVALVAISLLMRMDNAYELGRPKKTTLPVVVVNDGDMKKETSPNHPNEMEEKKEDSANHPNETEEKKTDTSMSPPNEAEKVSVYLCLFHILHTVIPLLRETLPVGSGGSPYISM